MATGQTINLQGSFTSAGVSHILNLPSGVDSIWIYNRSVEFSPGTADANNAALPAGYAFYWDSTMTAANPGVIYTKGIGATYYSSVGPLAASAGITLIDTSLPPIAGPAVALTSITNANPPVVATASTAGLSLGSIVRLYNVTGGLQVSGMDFTVGTIVTNTSFTLAYMQPPTAMAAATNGFYSIVQWDTLFYPRRRFITNIQSVGATTVVTMSVTHSFTIGQQVRLVVPRASANSLGFGMYQINGMTGNIIALTQTATSNTITLDINSSGFSAFVFPVTADYAITFAEVIPVGEATNISLAYPGTQMPLDYAGNPIPYTQSGILADATVNTGIRGLLLAGGTASAPAGQAARANGAGTAPADFITWSAMVAYSVDPNS